MRTLVPMRSALSGALAAIAMFAAPSASAFCRTVSEKPPANWEVATQGCFTGSADAKVLYWAKACVGYNLQRDASRQATLAQATAAAATAFSAWNQATCADGGNVSVNVADLGPVECAEVRYNKTFANQNVIVFRDDVWPYMDAGSTLGVTTVTFDTRTGEILGADMEINGTQTLRVPPAPQAENQAALLPDDQGASDGYDLTGIIMHEAGHFLGLAHSAQENAVMYEHYHEISQLIDDDTAALCAAYPSDHTRVTSAGVVAAGACDPTPPHGFSSQCAAPPSDPPSASSSNGGCSVRALPASGRGVASGWCILAPALGISWLRRARRRAGHRAEQNVFVATRAHGSRAVRVALGAGLAAWLAVASSRASVSIAVLFDELVGRSRAAAIVTPVERHSVWEDGRIVTYTHARVDRVIAGNVSSETWLRTLGGNVDHIGQLVDGEAALDIDRPVLVFLQRSATAMAHPDAQEVTARAQGEFPVSIDATAVPRLSAMSQAGAIVLPRAARISNVRLAAKALTGRTVEEAASDIATAWPELHRDAR